MTTQTYQIIKNAILKKKQIIATYKEHVREMCPHAIGYKNGKEQAFFYQFGGYGSKGKITSDSKNNWRCLTISDLENVSVRDGAWHTFSNYAGPKDCIDTIDVKI